MLPILDHESHIKELESNLASSMRWEFRLCQRVSILEGCRPVDVPRSLDSDAPRLHHHGVPGERGTPYPRLLQHLQMACQLSGPREENRESWASKGSEACLLRLIPIEN